MRLPAGKINAGAGGTASPTGCATWMTSSRRAARGLSCPVRQAGPGRGLAEFTAIIERGGLLAFLARACPVGPRDPPAASPACRVPLAQVPLLSTGTGPAGPGGTAADLPQDDAAHAVTGGSGLLTDVPWCYPRARDLDPAMVLFSSGGCQGGAVPVLESWRSIIARS